MPNPQILERVLELEHLNGRKARTDGHYLINHARHLPAYSTGDTHPSVEGIRFLRMSPARNHLVGTWVEDHLFEPLREKMSADALAWQKKNPERAKEIARASSKRYKARHPNYQSERRARVALEKKVRELEENGGN